jgi:hypothetical protein
LRTVPIPQTLDESSEECRFAAAVGPQQQPPVAELLETVEDSAAVKGSTLGIERLDAAGTHVPGREGIA